MTVIGFFFLVIFLVFTACSNSIEVNGYSSECSLKECCYEETFESSASALEYLPLDDLDHPYTGIPRIVIETDGFKEIQDKETEIPARLQIYGENAPTSSIFSLTIKGRGNSSWNYSKKPYTIKFYEKVPFLGMPKAKKWVLLANYRDRTLLRNAVAFEIAKRTGLRWTPSGVFVDVYINRKYLGNYYLCEKIQIKTHRLNLSEDAYLLEFDKSYDEEYKFKTKYVNIPVNLHSPKNPSEEQFNYIQDYLNEIEYRISDTTGEANYQELIDVESFADFLIVNELTQNAEIGHPKSVYVYKDVNQKLFAGPVWDFDWQTFNKQITYLRNKRSFWYIHLWPKEEFRQVVSDRWNMFRNSFKTLDVFIDSLADYTRKSNEQNYKKWPVKVDKDAIGDENENFETAIQMMKDALQERIRFLDTAFTYP